MAEVAKIDPDLCTACAACIDECPVECIAMNSDETTAVVNAPDCTGCEACVACCPTEAIAMVAA